MTQTRNIDVCIKRGNPSVKSLSMFSDTVFTNYLNKTDCATPPFLGDIYRHKKRCSAYGILGRASLVEGEYDDESFVYIVGNKSGQVFCCSNVDLESNIQWVLKARLQTEDPGLLSTNMTMIVYEAADGSIWVREHSEFMDGRFELTVSHKASEDISKASVESIIDVLVDKVKPKILKFLESE